MSVALVNDEGRLSRLTNCAKLALRRFEGSPASKDVNFTLRFFPYQLYPDATKEGEDKYDW